MRELRNEFKWSVSRDRHFRECQRLFYLSHYAHWGGWQLNADEFTKTCYRLTKMKNLDMWAGEIVHQVIFETLTRLRSNQPISLDRMTSRAVHLLRTGWRESKNEDWRRDPKRHVNLFEHYYNLDIPRDRTEEIKQRVLTCLANFWRSSTLRLIEGVRTSQWRCLEEFQSLRLEGFQVVMKMDFALEHDGTLYIYDWKTGKEQSDDMTQLICYALYAIKCWRFPVDRIKIVLAYLRHNLFQEHRPLPSQIIEMQEQILQRCLQILSLLTDPGANVASVENFPMTSERWRCKRCFFWEACYGNREIQDQEWEESVIARDRP